MQSADSRVMAPLVHVEDLYSSGRPWGMAPSHQDSTLSRINRLHFIPSLATLTRQPSTYLQPQPLTSRPGYLNLWRDINYSTRDQYSSRSSGSSWGRRPLGWQRDGDSFSDRYPSSQQENLGATWYPSSHHANHVPPPDHQQGMIIVKQENFVITRIQRHP